MCREFCWCEDTQRVMPRKRAYKIKVYYEKDLFVEKVPNYDSVTRSFSLKGKYDYYAGTIKVDKPVPKID